MEDTLLTLVQDRDFGKVKEFMKDNRTSIKTWSNQTKYEIFEAAALLCNEDILDCVAGDLFPYEKWSEEAQPLLRLIDERVEDGIAPLLLIACRMGVTLDHIGTAIYECELHGLTKASDKLIEMCPELKTLIPIIRKRLASE